MKLSIVVPVFNEEKTVIQILKIVSSIDYGIPSEIVVVNDGSTDKTPEKLTKAKDMIKNIRIISYQRNRGKGHAIRKGIKNSNGDIIVIQDADLEYNPNQIPDLIQPILDGEYKVVYGSRFLGKYESMTPTQLLGNKFLTFMTNLLFGSKVTDMETCYKVIHKNVFKELHLRSNRFEIEPEITAKILKAGFRIREIPIKYSARKKEQGKKINWVDGVKSLLMLFKVKFNLY